MEYRLFQDSRIGGRTSNQDRTAHERQGEDVLLVVADGMGGHARGELAAHIAVTALVEAFHAQSKLGIHDPGVFLRGAMLSAHNAISEYARSFNLPDSPRTTCVACIVTDGIAHWVHAGDSRLYLVQDGRVAFVTRDHTKVQLLVEHGVITADEAGHHPERNMVFSCLGGSMLPTLDAGAPTALKSGDALILCSDGFWSELAADEIASFVQAAPLDDALRRLVAKAEERAGARADNISVVGLKCVEKADES